MITLQTSVVIFIFKVNIASKCKLCFLHIIYLFCSFFNKVSTSRQEKCFIYKYATPGNPKIGRCSILDK